MTPEDEICSILTEWESDKTLSGWPLRELSQRGMNYSRHLSEHGDWIYLFFLELNLSQRKSVPAIWGRFYALKQRLFLRRIPLTDDWRRFINASSSFAQFAEKFAVKKH